MATYAIIQTGGKQYQVSPGDVLDVERLEAEVGATVDFADIRMIGGGGDVMLGAPQVAGAHVMAEVQDQRKGPKLIVFKYKAKKHYRKKTGHRQQYTRLVINEIIADGKVLAKIEERWPGAKRDASSAVAVAEAPEAVEEDVVAAGEATTAEPEVTATEPEAPGEATAAEPEAAATEPDATEEPASEETGSAEQAAEEAPVEAPREPEGQETRRDGT